MRTLSVVLIVTLFLLGCGAENWTSATVLEKWQHEETTYVKGGNVLIPIVDHRFAVAIRFGDGKTDVADVNINLWLELKIGSRVRVRCNSRWGIEEIQLEGQTADGT